MAETRVALVLGNSDYKSARRLPNAAGDAAAMMATLRSLGFDVVHGFNLDEASTVRRVDEFGMKAAMADVAVIYYAGHGMQWRGTNYMVAIDGVLPASHLPTKDGIGSELVRGNLQFDQLLKRARTHKKGGVNIVLLDACRNDPWDRETAALPPHGVPGGPLDRSNRVEKRKSEIAALGRMEVAETYIAHATLPGSIADDGAGENSPFTAALLKYIRNPNESIHELMAKVISDVVSVTGGRQRPSFVGSLSRNFSFNPQTVVQPAPPPPAAKPTPVPEAATTKTTPRAEDKWGAGLKSTSEACERQFAEARAKSDPIEALANFVSDCAGHSRVAEAASIRNKLIANRSDHQACETAGKADTILAYRNYLALFPQGSCQFRAQKRIKEIETQLAMVVTPRDLQPQLPTPLLPRPQPQYQPPAQRFICERAQAIAWLERYGAYSSGGDRRLDATAYDEYVQWIGGDGKVEIKPRWKVLEEDVKFKEAYPIRTYTIQASSAAWRDSRCEISMRLDYYRKRPAKAAEQGTVDVTFAVGVSGSEPRIVAQRIRVVARR